MTPLLACRDLTVRFGGLEALSNLSLDVADGEVLGIAGPNGAGKTTLFNVISGHVRPAAGSVVFRGRSITGLPSDRIYQLGIARTFQIPQLIGSQSVYSNVLVGAHFAGDRSVGTTLSFPVESHRLTAEAITAFRLSQSSGRAAGTVSLYERKLVMLASAMAHRPALLLLDEPASGLSGSEADAIVAEVLAIRCRGTAVIVIEHMMRVLMAISDRVAILNRGGLLFEGSPAEARASADVQRLYFGTGASP